MKTLVIPDIHGKEIWKEAIQKYVHDRVIFLGDYVDAELEITDQQIRNNLVEIIDLKKSFPSEVFLLLGNHDIHYLYYPKYPCSGFRINLQPELTLLFKANQDLFQIAYQSDSYLFTHAGISGNWYDKHRESLNLPGTLAEKLNAINNSGKKDILHEVGEIRGGYGQGKQFGGPTWADKSETMFSMLEGYHQVVGHSKVIGITKKFPDDNEESETSITYCDCLNSNVDFLVLDLKT